MANDENDIEASRFRALLNPIRDLAESWGIDIAKELTDYAISLGIDVDADDHEADLEASSAPVDFAEAALLVQGSTSVYSRKVEHLYGLVYEAVAKWNSLKQKDKAFENGTTEPANKDTDADRLLDVDKINFLDLNDVKVETADEKAITLPEEDLPPAGSLQDATSLRPIPRMLMRGNASEQDNLERSNFKMLTAHTHPSGALVMEGCPPVTEDLSTLPTTDTSSAMPVSADDDCDHDHDNGFDGFTDDDDAGFSTPPPMPAPSFDNEDIIVAVTGSAKKSREPRTIHVETKKRPKPKKDPFLMLDPHDPIPSLDKPLRVGKTYRKPRITKHNSDGAKLESVLFDEDLTSDLDFTYCVLDPIPSGASIKSYLCYEGLRRPYREILRQRLAVKRRNAFHSSRLVDQAVAVEQEDEELAADMPNDDNQHHVSFADGGDIADGGFDDDPDDFPAFPSLDDNDDRENDDEIQDAFDLDRRASEQIEKMAAEYTKVCREHIAKTAQLWQQRAADEELVKRVRTWRERIQPILDEEELRPAFDITAYGQSLVKRFPMKDMSTSTPEKKMKSLFQAPERYEVCRLFLATLQLANTCTIEIVDSTSNLNGTSNPAVKLIASSTEAEKIGTPVRSKRQRQPGSTPKSARRPPLRPRIEV